MQIKRQDYPAYFNTNVLHIFAKLRNCNNVLNDQESGSKHHGPQLRFDHALGRPVVAVVGVIECRLNSPGTHTIREMPQHQHYSPMLFLVPVKSVTQTSHGRDPHCHTREDCTTSHSDLHMAKGKCLIPLF